MAFELYASNEPTFQTEYIRMYDIVDYITLIACTISFLFGWSPFVFLIETNVIGKCTRRRDSRTMITNTSNYNNYNLTTGQPSDVHRNRQIRGGIAPCRDRKLVR